VEELGFVFVYNVICFILQAMIRVASLFFWYYKGKQLSYFGPRKC